MSGNVSVVRGSNVLKSVIEWDKCTAYRIVAFVRSRMIKYLGRNRISYGLMIFSWTVRFFVFVLVGWACFFFILLINTWLLNNRFPRTVYWSVKYSVVVGIPGYDLSFGEETKKKQNKTIFLKLICFTDLAISVNRFNKSRCSPASAKLGRLKAFWWWITVH